MNRGIDIDFCYVDMRSVFEGAPYKAGNGANGKTVIVRVYHSMDKGHGNPPVEHVRELGSFEVEGLKGMSALEFLEMVRKGVRRTAK